MILKLEIYLDVEPGKKAKENIQEFKNDLQFKLNSDAISLRLKSLISLLELSSDSYQFLTKEEIFERMRTNGKT